MNKLLFDESPLVIQPSLAVKIGLNEAIFIQQIHYWIVRSKHIVNGLKWAYNTYEELHEQFPFWSIRTIKGIVKNLKDEGLLFVENHSKDKRDKTNWYGIDYDTLNSFVHSAEVAPSDSAEVAPSIVQDLHDVYSKIKETPTENITENKKINKKRSETFSFILQKNTQYSNLSKEYKTKLFHKILLIDKAQNYEDFILALESKDYSYKNFEAVYRKWYAKLKENDLGGREIEIDGERAEEVIYKGKGYAINTDTLEAKVGTVKTQNEENTVHQHRQDESKIGIICNLAERMRV